MNYNKEEFINIDNMTDYLMQNGLSYAELKSILKAKGVWEEWYNEYVDVQLNKIKNDKEFIAKLESKMETNKSINQICLSQGYTYKAIERYLIEIGYKPNNEISPEELDNIKEIINDDYIAKRKKWYKNWRKQKEFNDEFKELNQELMQIAAASFQGFNYRGISVDVIDGYEFNRVSKKDIVKALGAVKAKELFPGLFKPVKQFKIKYNYDKMK